MNPSEVLLRITDSFDDQRVFDASLLPPMYSSPSMTTTEFPDPLLPGEISFQFVDDIEILDFSVDKGKYLEMHQNFDTLFQYYAHSQEKIVSYLLQLSPPLPPSGSHAGRGKNIERKALIRFHPRVEAIKKEHYAVQNNKFLLNYLQRSDSILEPGNPIVSEFYQYLSTLNEYDQKINDICNPLDKVEDTIGSLFGNRAAIKLAEIDAIYNVTGASNGLLSQTANNRFSFVDIAGGPGSFTRYILYRQVKAQGTGITIRGTKPSFSAKPKRDKYGKPIKEAIDYNRHNNGISDSLNWYGQNKINPNAFTPVEGADRSGDLFVHWFEFIRVTRERFPGGVSLAVADGGYEAKVARWQEMELSMLVLFQIVAAIFTLSNGGVFVLKIFESTRKITIDMIYILTCLFTDVTIYKPIGSRIRNAERYLIAKNFHGVDQQTYQNHPYMDLLFSAAQHFTGFLSAPNGLLQYPQDQHNEIKRQARFVSLLSGDYPERFKQWIRTNNMSSVITRNVYVKQFVSLYNDGQFNKELINELHAKRTQYDYDQALVIWNLPGKKDKEYAKFTKALR
jgi:23S rRNA U2552 (ribose-2'-O)-methylase RlmE/FtsJ